jgi:hypothetical protein
MKAREYILNFLLVFIVAFLVNAVISLLWNYFIRERGFDVNWEQSFRLGLILGIVIPLSQALGKK